MTTTGDLGNHSGSQLSGLVIDGEIRTEGSAGTATHHYPATGDVNSDVPLGGVSEIDEAVWAAQAALDTWRRIEPTARRDMLWRLSERISDMGGDLELFGRLETGIPIRGFRWRLGLALEWIRTYAGYAARVGGDLTASDDDGRVEITRPEPYGVVGIVITWNSPLLSLAMKVPAALAAGNTVVIKPSELTPFTPGLFVQACREAGIPDGVVNVVTGGVAAGEALVRHPVAAKISFTGGERTASAMMRTGADLIKPFCFELGGKSAYVVFDDADVGQVVALAHGELSNAGQSCKFGSRLLVHRSRHAELTNRLTKAVSEAAVGDPADPETHMGPLISRDAQSRVLELIERSEAAGHGTLLTGGIVPPLPRELQGGYYVAPTVFDDVDPQSDLAQEEVFGPVFSIIPFDEESEAVEIANGTRFGLSAYVHTTDLRRAHRVAAQMKAGTVYVNDAPRRNTEAPFGGFGASGIGREGGRAGLDEFLRLKTIGFA